MNFEMLSRSAHSWNFVHGRLRVPSRRMVVNGFWRISPDGGPAAMFRMDLRLAFLDNAGNVANETAEWQ